MLDFSNFANNFHFGVAVEPFNALAIINGRNIDCCLFLLFDIFEGRLFGLRLASPKGKHGVAVAVAVVVLEDILLGLAAVRN